MEQDLTKAFKYGRDMVPFGDEDISAMKLEASKCMQLLGTGISLK